MGTAVYTHPILKETYELKGIKDISQAWRMFNFACRRNGWNPIDYDIIKVRFKK